MRHLRLIMHLPPASILPPCHRYPRDSFYPHPIRRAAALIYMRSLARASVSPAYYLPLLLLDTLRRLGARVVVHFPVLLSRCSYVSFPGRDTSVHTIESPHNKFLVSPASVPCELVCGYPFSFEFIVCTT